MTAAKPNKDNALVFTIRELCRVCYTCVRECPVKAIRIVNGQAEVMEERCIACGNCTKVCSQGAKGYKRSIEEVNKLLQSPERTIALVAPSFPAEFEEIEDYKRFVGMVKSLGFDQVCEVGFGADIVAAKYREILDDDDPYRYISADCPAIVNFIRRYHPGLVKSLAKIVSPMVAMSRVALEQYGEDSKLVFIGPCVAKKDESDEVDAVITFTELRAMFEKAKVKSSTVLPREFDPPRSGKGAIFPISRGLLQTINIQDDVVEGNVIVAEGRHQFPEAVKEFEDGLISSHHLELLCCEGCIMGAGMSDGGKQFARRTLVGNYVKQKLANFDEEDWNQNLKKYSHIDLNREYDLDDQRIAKPSKIEIEAILNSMGKIEPRDHLNCGACGYDTCEEHAIAIIKGLAEIEMCLPYTIEMLHDSVKDLAVSNEKLVSMQQALKQTEKLASMGQLSAGIAHELNNPLGVVIMYANLLLDEADKESDLYEDLKLIVDQTNRCKKIVGGLLNFARKNQVLPEKVDAREIIKKSLESVIIPENIELNLIDHLKKTDVMMDSEQMIQVFSNLVKNSCEAINGEGEIEIVLEDTDSEVIFSFKDSGSGIKQEDLSKIFEPFFTTKEIGKGTGLGLATSYGIVKMHKGKIEVKSNAIVSLGPTFTNFVITLPRK